MALALLLAAWGGSVPAQAETGASRARLTPEQSAKVFPETRALALKDRRLRIAILQNSERCLGAAGSPEALRRCLREERQAMQKQRQANGAAMRKLLESNGIPVPEPRRRGAGGVWGEGGEGGG